MKLKSDIDAQIRAELDKLSLAYSTSPDGKLEVVAYRMDLKAKMGMLYLKPDDMIPSGALLSAFISADWINCVFHHHSEAVIIEAHTNALDGELVDFYENLRKA